MKIDFKHCKKITEWYVARFYVYYRNTNVEINIVSMFCEYLFPVQFYRIVFIVINYKD